MNWNTRAKIYDIVFSLPLIKEGRKKEIACFKELLEEAKKAEKFSSSGQKITLDIGCGSGEFLRFHSSFAIGLDISQEMLKKAREKNNNSSFVLGSALSLPFKSNSFDFVSSVGLSEYFGDVSSFLGEVSRVAGENSTAIISYTPKSLFNVFRKLWGIKFFERSWGEIERAIEASGFELIKEKSMLIQAQVLLKKIK